MAKYTISYSNAEGVDHEVEGDSLHDLALQLREVDYQGPNIRVLTEQGFTAGWVGADGHYQAA